MPAITLPITDAAMHRLIADAATRHTSPDALAAEALGLAFGRPAAEVMEQLLAGSRHTAAYEKRAREVERCLAVQAKRASARYPYARKRPLYVSIPLWGEQFGLLNRAAEFAGCPANETTAAAALAYLSTLPSPDALRDGLKASHVRYCSERRTPVLPFKLP